MMLNRVNINDEIKSYLNKVGELTFPEHHVDRLRFIHGVKREPLGAGPYPNVSLFEASNRIFSDVTALFGIHRLLNEPEVNKIQLPFAEYEVALGVEGGDDLYSSNGGEILVGEVFNVARTFFQTKKTAMLKKLRLNTIATFRLVIFNADAVTMPTDYYEKSTPSMLYLPVDIWEYRKQFQS